MSEWLDKKKLNSVSDLIDVHKAIYLMRSITNAGVYRFGGIGISSSGENSAIKRLAQCCFSENGKIKSKWIYVSMKKFDRKIKSKNIRDMETLVRKGLMGENGKYGDKRNGKKDEIRGVFNERQLIRDFRRSLEQ